MYLSKEDESPLDYGPVPVHLESSPTTKEKISQVVATMLQNGSTIDEINKEHPGYVMLNYKKLVDYQNFVRISNQQPTLPWHGLSYSGSDEATASIVDWANLNIKQPRVHKQLQLYVYGPTNYLKTSFWLKLINHLRIYVPPQSEHYFDFYLDGSYDLVVFDEFNAYPQPEWMNNFLDGAPMNISRKGSQILKTDKVPVIILSNYSLLELRYRGHAASTFASRLKVVSLSQPLDLDNVFLNDPPGSSSPRPPDFDFHEADEYMDSLHQDALINQTSPLNLHSDDLLSDSDHDKDEETDSQ